MRLTTLDARIPARFGMGVPISLLKMVTVNGFQQPEHTRAIDELHHFVLLCCGNIEHMIMTSYLSITRKYTPQLPLPLVKYFFPHSHICCQICFISRKPTAIVKNKSKHVLTLIANYISLKKKVSRETIRNPHNGSSNIFECT